MGKTRLYIVPGYNMTEQDVDSLLYFAASIPDFSEYDELVVQPILRTKDGSRFNLNLK